MSAGLHDTQRERGNYWRRRALDAEAELGRERGDAWEALDGTNVKALQERVAELEAALTSILEHWHDVSDNTNHNLLQVALKGKNLETSD